MTSSKTEDLVPKALSILRDIPSPNLERLIAAWNSGTRVTKYNLEEVTGIYGQKAKLLAVLISDPSIEQRELKSMLVMGLASKSEFYDDANMIEIVWTGPSRINSGVRNTRPVIEDMLKSAKQGEKITIVDYRITSNAESIVNELNSCLADGVKVDIIVDKSRANRNELKKCFAEKGLTRPAIYTRKGRESKYYKIHAKVIIIHDRQMLVSSANLTELGTEINFELGLLVSGPVVKQMLGLIARMIDKKYFEGGI